MDEQDVKPEENKGTKIAITDAADTPAASEAPAAVRPVVNDITPPPAPSTDVVEAEEPETTNEPTVDVSTPATDSTSTDEDHDELEGEPTEETSNDDETTDDSSEPTEPLAEAPAEEPSNDEVANEQVTSVIGQENTEPQAAEVLETPQLKTPSQEGSDTPSTLPDGAMATVGMAASQMNKPPHRNNKKLAAIVTIFAALILAGVAVFVYLSANTNTAEDTTKVTPTDNSNTGQAVAPVAPATTADIDTTDTAVDEALSSLDEAADFADTDLSDTSLGL